MSEHHIDFPADIKQNSTPLGALISESYRNEALKKKKIIQRKKIALGLLSLILVGLTYFGFFFPTTREFLDKLIHRTPGPERDLQSYINVKKAMLSHTSEEVEWDGPSVFKTGAQNFNLVVGGGRLSGIVKADQEPIDEVELRIKGKIFYQSGEVEVAKIPITECQLAGDVDITHQGLHIVIEKSNTDFTATISLEDSDDSSGASRPISAAFEFTIVFPKHYNSYKKLSVLANPINGENIDILIWNTLKIEFADLDLQANGGYVHIGSRIATERLNTHSLKWTKVSEVNNVPGRAIFISADTVQESLVLHLVASPVNKAETRTHSFSLNSEEGDVTASFQPLSSATPGTKQGPVSFKVKTGSGKIDTVVVLAEETQVLFINAESISGDIHSAITDNYSGILYLDAWAEEVTLSEKKDSSSKIEYEVRSSNKIVASKTFASSSDVGDGNVFLSSKRAKVAVDFL